MDLLLPLSKSLTNAIYFSLLSMTSFVLLLDLSSPVEVFIPSFLAFLTFPEGYFHQEMG